MIDTPVQVDLDSLSDKGAAKLQEVYAVVSVLLDTDTVKSEVIKQDIGNLLSSFNDIKVRDGVFKYFTLVPRDMRLDMLRSLTEYLDHGARKGVDSELIAKSTGYLAAMMYLHAAFKLEIGDTIDEELAIASGLIEDAERLGGTTSLLSLLKTAIVTMNVPVTVFKDSIDAVTLEECVEHN